MVFSRSLALAALLTIPFRYGAKAQAPDTMALQDGSTVPIRLNATISGAC